MKELLDAIAHSVAELEVERVPQLCQEALEKGVPPLKVVDAMAEGMEEVGKRFEAQEYFLTELLVAGQAMKRGMAVVEPHLKGGSAPRLGRVVIGTVEGDLHDIGKNLVETLLQAAGFEVIDLGVDVGPDQFVEAVKQHRPDILAMSALLTVCMPAMGRVVEALVKAGLRDQVKVIIGGAPITPEFAREIGADAMGRDAVEGVAICKSWIQAEVHR